MSIAVLFEPVEMTCATYRQVVEMVKQDGEWPPRGLRYHATFGGDGKLRTYEVWESVHDLQRFASRLSAVLAAQRIRPVSPLVSELVAEMTVPSELNR